MSLFAEEDSFPDEPIAAPEDQLTEPRLMASVQGHDSIEQTLLNLFNNDTLPHGLIFTGIKGIGKATMAHRIAKFLLTQSGAGETDMFGDTPPPPTNMDTPTDHKDIKLYLAGAHPDCITIERRYDEAKKHPQSITRSRTNP